MSVRSVDLPDTPRGSKPSTIVRDPSGCLMSVGGWMALLAFGGVFFAINGGFSVIGLGIVLGSFNDAGRILWAVMEAITFRVPVVVPGLPTTQPLIPWLGVLAASMLQVAVLWRKLSKRSIPPVIIAFTALLSLYDLGTTFYGFGTVAWIMRAGVIIQAPLAILFTFGLEIVTAILLRKR